MTSTTKSLSFMKVVSLFFVCIMLAMATGCATNQVEYKEKVVYKETQIPTSLLKKCQATVPPNAKNYVASNWDKKEETLIVYSQSLLKDIADCNSQIKGINDFVIKNNEAIKAATDKEGKP